MSFEAIIDGLAAHRLTRLVTADTITQPARATLIRIAYDADPDAYHRMSEALDREVDKMSDAELDDLPEVDEQPPKLAAFIRCRWCTGLWISGFVVVARRYCPRVWDPVARALALSTVAALIAGLEQ